MTSALYVDTGSPVHRLNPVTKLVALLSILVVVFALPQWWVSAIVVAGVLSSSPPSWPAADARWPGSADRSCCRSWSCSSSQGLTFPGGRTVLWEWGVLSLTSEGPLFALDVGARIICLVLASVPVLTTHPGDLMSAPSPNTGCRRSSPTSSPRRCS